MIWKPSIFYIRDRFFFRGLHKRQLVSTESLKATMSRLEVNPKFYRAIASAISPLFVAEPKASPRGEGKAIAGDGVNGMSSYHNGGGIGRSMATTGKASDGKPAGTKRWKV